VRVAGGTLLPWAHGRCDAGEDEWALSAIRLPGWWLAGEGEPVCVDPRLAALVQQLKTQRPALKYRVVLPMVPDGDGGWHCILAGQSPLRLSYCDRRGLQRER